MAAIAAASAVGYAGAIQSIPELHVNPDFTRQVQESEDYEYPPSPMALVTRQMRQVITSLGINQWLNIDEPSKAAIRTVYRRWRATHATLNLIHSKMSDLTQSLITEADSIARRGGMGALSPNERHQRRVSIQATVDEIEQLEAQREEQAIKESIAWGDVMTRWYIWLYGEEGETGFDRRLIIEQLQKIGFPLPPFIENPDSESTLNFRSLVDARSTSNALMPITMDAFLSEYLDELFDDTTNWFDSNKALQTDQERNGPSVPYDVRQSSDALGKWHNDIKYRDRPYDQYHTYRFGSRSASPSYRDLIERNVFLRTNLHDLMVWQRYEMSSILEAPTPHTLTEKLFANGSWLDTYGRLHHLRESGTIPGWSTSRDSEESYPSDETLIDVARGVEHIRTDEMFKPLGISDEETLSRLWNLLSAHFIADQTQLGTRQALTSLVYNGLARVEDAFESLVLSKGGFRLGDYVEGNDGSLKYHTNTSDPTPELGPGPHADGYRFIVGPKRRILDVSSKWIKQKFGFAMRWGEQTTTTTYATASAAAAAAAAAAATAVVKLNRSNSSVQPTSGDSPYRLIPRPPRWKPQTLMVEAVALASSFHPNR